MRISVWLRARLHVQVDLEKLSFDIPVQIAVALLISTCRWAAADGDPAGVRDLQLVSAEKSEALSERRGSDPAALKDRQLISEHLFRESTALPQRLEQLFGEQVRTPCTDAAANIHEDSSSTARFNFILLCSARLHVQRLRMAAANGPCWDSSQLCISLLHAYVFAQMVADRSRLA
jgi:hypothetical protein